MCPGPELDKFSRALLVQLWSQTLDEIGEERFDAALRTVLQESTFRPSIAEIRKAAGVNRGIVDPVERDALEGLRAIIEAMRKHGPKLRAILGAIKNGGRDALGLIAMRPEREPETPAPVFSSVVEAAIVEFGWGSREDGLAAIAEHPALYGKRSGSEELPPVGFREKNAADIEKRWVRGYAEALRVGAGVAQRGGE